MTTRHWLGEFWSAQEGYDFWKTRSAVNTGACSTRMLRAVDELLARGVPEVGRRMPTLDEFEKKGNA